MLCHIMLGYLVLCCGILLYGTLSLSYVMLCYVALCYSMCVMSCYATLRCVMLCSVLLCCLLLRSVQFCPALLRSVVPASVLFCCVPFSSNVLSCQSVLCLHALQECPESRLGWLPPNEKSTRKLKWKLITNQTTLAHSARPCCIFQGTSRGHVPIVAARGSPYLKGWESGVTCGPSAVFGQRGGICKAEAWIYHTHQDLLLPNQALTSTILYTSHIQTSSPAPVWGRWMCQDTLLSLAKTRKSNCFFL